MLRKVKNKLRVLFIDDSESDVMLETALLQQAGFEFSAERVDTRETLQRALEDKWDIILSDYSMPSFNGLDALHLVRATDPNIPFILITGAIGEEEAVAIIRAGAQDYINKNRTGRLVPAIQRELAKAQLRSEKDLAQQALKHEQAFAKQLLDTAPVIILVLNSDGNIDHVNPYFEQLSGYRLDEIRGKEWFNTFLPTRDQEKLRELFHTAWEGERTRGNINPIVTRDGRELQIEWHDSPLFDHHGNMQQLLVIGQDVTERIKAELWLRKSESQLTEAQRVGRMGSWNWDIKSGQLEWSDEIYRIFGFQHRSFEPTYTGFLDSVHPDDRQMLEDAVNRSIKTMQPYNLDHRIVLPDGLVRYVHEKGEVQYSPTREPLQMIGTIQDVTDRKLAEERILATLDEKETVLRELHHRVKNNMQVISSLLSLQARYPNTKNPQLALQESRQRIRAMALVHERIYSTTDLAAVNFLDYLRYLSDRMVRLYHVAGVTLKIQVSGEPIQVPIDQALPCALICNELITNAIHHAYPSGQVEQLVEIRLSTSGDDQLSIMVRDYGRGIEHNSMATDKPSTLGMVIIQALSRQLGGEIHLELSTGTIATLTFPINNDTRHESTL